MSSKNSVYRSLAGALAVLAAAQAGPAAALEFQLFDEPLRLENLFTVGASWRTQNPDDDLIGKSTLYAMTHPGGQGLCMTRTSGTPDSGPSPINYQTDPGNTSNTYGPGATGEGVCATSGDVDGPGAPPSAAAGSANTAYLTYPGSFSPNGDNGDLNFSKGDIVHAVAKLTTDLNWSFHEYNLFVRGVALFDANYNDFTETHYDTTMQAARSKLPESVRRLVGVDYDFLDYNVGHTFSVAGHDVAVKVGDQVLNWGESSLLALNSLNTINPPDARRLNMPGLDLKEAFRPLGMITLGTPIIEAVSIDAFYTYDWKPILIDPVGSFFSQSDTLGPGGDYAMLSFGKSPEDPGFALDDPRYPAGKRGYYRPIDTCTGGTAPCQDALGLLGSTAGRTVYRDHAQEQAREPKGGDYGAVVKTFLESINNGTEVSLYFANYDSRLPVVSTFAARNSCIRDTGSAAAATFATDCGFTGPGQPDAQEPIPVDTMRLMVEYPKDIKMYGVSFNTTVGDYALSGEYAFRTNLPIQIDTVDLTYTSLQPAFPGQDVVLGATTIPGRQSAFPTYLTAYRGYACTSDDATCIQPGQYIPGFERFRVGQANLTVLRLIGGDNPLGASQMTLLMEMGMQKVFNMPSLSVLQLEGSGSDTHASCGAGETAIVCGPIPDPPPVAGNSRGPTLRQNPTPNLDLLGYGSSESYGFRFINLNRWESALFGINLETLSIVRWDVKGTSPGIGTNFSDGRKQFNFGVRGDYLATYVGEVRYTWFTGGNGHDGQRDRDNIFVTFGYQF